MAYRNCARIVTLLETGLSHSAKYMLILHILFLKVQMITYKMKKKNRLDTMQILGVVRI